MKMTSIKFIDRWIGLLLCTLLAPIEKFWPRRPAGQVKRILVIKFWGIGSIIMTGYLLRSIKSSMPDASVELATILSNRDMAEMIGGADEIVTLDISKNIFKIISDILKFLLQIYRRRYDVVLDLEYLTRFSALATFATRSPIRAGFYARGFWRGNFHDKRVPFNPYWHVRENFLNVGRFAGFNAETPYCIPIEPGAKAEAEAAHFREIKGVTKPYLIVNPNAGETSLERRWPTERFGELAARINRELNASVVVIGSASEYQTAADVVHKAGSGAVINSAGMLSLRGLAALMKEAAAAVSNDSGPLHLASHVGIPVVGLYGPETPALWGPISPDARCVSALFKNLDCSPCINVHNMKTVVCLREGAECMLDIDVDDVFEALKNLLKYKMGI